MNSQAKIKVAINGFGRIGRLILRAAVESKDSNIDIVAINDFGSSQELAQLLKYDSTHGTVPFSVVAKEGQLEVAGKSIACFAEPAPDKLPWAEHDIDIVFECTGRFASRDEAARHLKGGAKRVMVSAPCSGADVTVVYGVNHADITQSHQVISNASCTTNCLAPVAYVLDELCGITRGYMTTIHAYTGDQKIVDTQHSDPRRARAGACNVIPTSTGAAKAVGLVLPKLKGLLDGTSLRVPVPNVSLVDLKFNSSKPVTAEAINKAMETAAAGKLKGVLNVNHEPLVSSDFNHNPASSIFDATQTKVIDDTFVRVLSWYDNEWGFSNRMLDTAKVVAANI